MKGFTLFALGRIRNTWVTDALSEILSTFTLALFVYASGAQYILTDGEASSVPGKALAAGVGLMMAVYCGLNASGSCVNPCIALMFCLTGKLKWKKYPLYVLCEFIGAFIAAALTFGIYYERIDQFDGGVRSVFGSTATAHIFTSFPAPGVSKKVGFFDVAIGCGLLTSNTLMIIDPNNANTHNGVAPIALVFLLYAIIMSFGINTGAPVNLSIDLSGRIFTLCAGYGKDVFTRGDHWFWVPPVACVTGTLFFVSVYQCMIGNHLPRQDLDSSLQEDTNTLVNTTGNVLKQKAVENEQGELKCQLKSQSGVTNETFRL